MNKLSPKLPRDMAVFDPRQIRDIAPDMLDAPGRPRVLPAAFYRTTTPTERALVCQRNGIYGLPTTELIDFLTDAIGGRTAIEIGAGHGGLAAALGIPATDSKMQDDPLVRLVYDAAGQPPVQYGSNVERLNAAEAIAHYRPQVVVACWVTHLYDERRHEAGGNMFGVDEDQVLDNCESYIFIGNSYVHRGKTIWNRPHAKIEPDWVYSRTINGSADFIAVWEGRHARTE
jgi:hypothetical protein